MPLRRSLSMQVGTGRNRQHQPTASANALRSPKDGDGDGDGDGDDAGEIGTSSHTGQQSVRSARKTQTAQRDHRREKRVSMTIDAGGCGPEIRYELMRKWEVLSFAAAVNREKRQQSWAKSRATSTYLLLLYLLADVTGFSAFGSLIHVLCLQQQQQLQSSFFN